MSLFAAIHAPTAAAPLLGLGLHKIAHTPTARLAMAYKLSPQRGCPSALDRPPCCARRLEELPLGRVEALQRAGRPPAPLPVARTLGENLLLDRLLAGGTVGEGLPLANLRIAAMTTCAPLGMIPAEAVLGQILDVTA